ncbi:hypothetical protein ACFRQM_33700 [Streptomyces sp. NPDC056831]|uniref:hypothetical protein n=1 Tax=Streptomyces sp. NPDC056831 TaxID=3345954 RepID=UPI0036AF4E7F
MAENYVHLASTDHQLEDALDAIQVTGPGACEPGVLPAGGEPMSCAQAEAMVTEGARTNLRFAAKRIADLEIQVLDLRQAVPNASR